MRRRRRAFLVFIRTCVHNGKWINSDVRLAYKNDIKNENNKNILKRNNTHTLTTTTVITGDKKQKTKKKHIFIFGFFGRIILLLLYTESYTARGEWLVRASGAKHFNILHGARVLYNCIKFI